MINIRTFNEKRDGVITSYDSEVYIEGEGNLVCHQLVTVFDRIYESSPELFEAVLLNCKYTQDHT